MATHWGGAVVRTTHVTGLFTDVGLLCGKLISLYCRKRCGRKFKKADRGVVADDLCKLSLLGMIASSFTVGIFVGAHLSAAMGHWAFLVPAGITGSIGLSYFIYRVFASHKLRSDEVPDKDDMEAPAKPLDPVSGAEKEHRASSDMHHSASFASSDRHDQSTEYTDSSSRDSQESSVEQSP